MIVSFRPHWVCHDYNSFGEAVMYCCWISWATLRLSERTVALMRAKSSGVTTCPIASGFRRLSKDHPCGDQFGEHRVLLCASGLTQESFASPFAHLITVRRSGLAHEDCHF